MLQVGTIEERRSTSTELKKNRNRLLSGIVRFLNRSLSDMFTSWCCVFLETSPIPFGQGASSKAQLELLCTVRTWEFPCGSERRCNKEGGQKKTHAQQRAWVDHSGQP